MWKLCILVIAALATRLAQAEPIPNWGIAVAAPNSAIITSGIASLNTALIQLTASVTSVTSLSLSTNADLSKASTSLIGLTKSITTYANYLKTNLTAANANTNSVDTAFSGVTAGVTALGTYLSEPAVDALANLTTTFNGSYVVSLTNAINILATTKLPQLATSLTNLQTAIGVAVTAAGGGVVTSANVAKNVSTALSTAVNNNLTAIKSSLDSITTAVKGIATGLVAANTYLSTINSANVTVNTTSLNSLKLVISKLSTGMNTTVLNYVNAAVKSIKTDWTNAVSKLKLFSTNATLNAFVTNYTTFASKNLTTDLNSLVAAAVANASQALNTLAVSQTGALTNTSSALLQAALTLANQVAIQIGGGGTTCSNKYASVLPTLIASIPTALTTCTTATTNFVTIAVTELNYLMQVPVIENNYYATAVASCSKYATFAKDDVVLAQALSCLTQSSSYGSLVNRIVSAGYAQAISYITSLNDPSSVLGAAVTACYSFQQQQIEAALTQLTADIATCAPVRSM
ncbi:uncharacterized protein LOC131430993 [Malaya genurostris]|uniref:uncharacterized protein LOC131430993 n=1 Tax=Malaya genurostris TaxID=325434 RepID=UPI0026F3C78A|nr:uncharacterized protein LOC131430993 [Malaya genurostris]